MPRFTLQSLFVAFTIIGIWLSTFTGYWGGQDIRACIWLLVIIGSALEAYWCIGRQKAFWLGFFAVMIATTFDAMSRDLGPQYDWARSLFIGF
jgi:hypothetical protein